MSRPCDIRETHRHGEKFCDTHNQTFWPAQGEECSGVERRAE